MFQTKTVGRKIFELRKEKNITQMELADLLGVSYQAVSNWERGNSMPDISKLSDLSRILGISIDDLLNDEKSSTIIKNVIGGTEEEYIKENEVSLDEINDIAPILKPNQTEKIVDKVIESSNENFKFEDIVAIAPNLDEDFLYTLIKNCIDTATLEDVLSIAPFLDEDDIDELAIGLLDADNVNTKIVVSLAPFMTEDGLDTIVNKYSDKINIEAIACFLDEDTVSDYAKKMYNLNEFDKIIKIACYMDSDDVAELALKAAKDDNIHFVTTVAPYIDDEDELHEIASILVKKHGISGIKGIMPFL
ncbi:helix-turn-helix domain-containing protein [Sedimentibacter sp. zth1]|uniref:helix-turn-helix domain-containing protein n=1 Tax=Sedimentibacter sp. zth1 TaxID=2816908 RepID=UPI001A921233|nr:helix-turn-helix domain-containing protein [Sedimentibacter sp. zth1]QSX04818.1 helix-turn-helix domain-containing protein [Sedimentibacter sp. zth1]